MIKMLKLQNVMDMTGLSRSTIYDKIAQGNFPKQVHLSPYCVVWVESEVQAWLQSKIDERDSRLVAHPLASSIPEEK